MKKRWARPLTRLAVVHFLLESQFWFPVWFIFLQYKGFGLETAVLVDGFFRLVMVLLEFPLGVVGDWLGRKRTYLLTTGFAVVTYALIVLIWNELSLFVAWGMWGVFWALASGTDVAYRYELIITTGQGSRVTHILGQFRAVAAVALLISHLTAGWLYALHPAVPFAVNGVFALLAFLIILTLPDADIRREEAGASLRQGVGTTMRVLRQNRVVMVGVLLMALVMTYFWTTRILFQPLLTDLGFAPASFGLVFLAYSGTGILTGLLTGRISDRLGQAWTIVFCALVLLLAVALVGFLPGRWALTGIPLLSFGFYLAMPILEAIVNAELKDVYRATVLSFGSLASSLMMIGTRPGIGLAADLTSVQDAYRGWAGVGVLVVAIVIVGLRYASRQRQVTSP